ncbi:MAG TPA: ABC transporter permease [Candidatus Hydrogenedentes bacterium]|nr:ABC transporter permease [Candidatus Hydrogenedentota bacterium]
MVTVLRQELVRHLRGTRLFVWAALFAALACVATGGLWPSPDAHSGQIGVASRSMLELLSALLAVTAILVVPAYGAAAISLERERETYDQLRLTQLSPFAIVAGKLLGILGIYTLICIAGLPIAATTYFLFGIDADVLGQLGIMGFAVAFSGACIGLLCSSITRKMIIAQTLTFLIVFAVTTSSSTLLAISTAPLSSVFMSSTLYDLAPARVLQTAVAGLLSATEIASFAALNILIGICAVAGAVLFVALDRRLDGAMDPKPIRRMLGPMQHFAHSGRHRQIPNLLNPIMVREARWGELMTWRWQVRLFVISTGILVAGLFATTTTLSPGIPPPATVWVMLQMVLVLFLVPGMTASTIVQERAQKSFEFLLMTGMRPSGIFLGKVFGVLATTQGILLPCLLSMLLAPILYPALGLRDGAILITGFSSLLVWMFVCACASTYACAIFERPTAAFAGSYVLCFLLFSGFGTGLFALKFYGTGTAFLSPVLGFIEKAADAGKDPLDQFNGPWMWHMLTHVVVGLIFILLALRAIEPFAASRRSRWQ